ncbi:Ig-like domain-containing protein [Candidatus Uhrbacteria bacterium]|nr:Ig-like domain-containing protein [Candidatus Uhrbacteria bacterium]
MKKWIIACCLAVAVASGTGWFEVLPALAQTLNADETFADASPETFAETAGFGQEDITLVIAKLIRAFLGFLGIVAVCFVLYGGYLWMMSRGDETKIRKAKMFVANAMIGTAIMFSSFAVAQYLITRMTEAVGGSVSSEEDGEGEYEDVSDVSSTFVLRSLNTACASVLRNLELQFVFSQNVSAATVQEQPGIVVSLADGDAVPGTFAVSTNRVTFTPTATCTASDGSTVACFEADTAYEVRLDSSLLKSTSGRSLACTTTYPCSFDFTTGSGIDVSAPTMAMTDPDDGDSVYAGEQALLQAQADDDSGVSSVAFRLEGDTIYTSGLDESLAGALSQANYFYGAWDTSGYVMNEAYALDAEGYDCAGNSAEAAVIDVVLRSATCDNGVLDAGDPYFETDVDCGGDNDSEYYCGACDGDACTDDSECSSGSCEDGVCVADVEIQRVSPGDGAPGNLITVSGDGFGDEPGTVVFLGDPDDSADDVVHVPYAQCDATWSDSQVIIQLGEQAPGGPLRLLTAEQLADRTDDDNGPVISDFVVNATVRPGLCEVSPASGSAKDVIDVFGNNFGDAQGSSTLYVGTSSASSYPAWSAENLEAIVPLLDSGPYDLQLFVGDGETREGSNTLAFEIASTVSSDSPPIISDVQSGILRCTGTGDAIMCTEDTDCTLGDTCEEDGQAGPVGQYVTIYGSDFGTVPGTVRFRNQDTDLRALADTSFPDVCGTDFWDDGMILVKVPETYDLSDDSALQAVLHDLWVVRGEDGVVSDPVDFEVIEGEAGPGICALEPDAGPSGTDVTVYGEGFETEAGSVTFFEDKDVFPKDWTSTQISGTTSDPLRVPEGARTGPVFVKDVDAQFSNSVNFEIGMCDVDFSCESGEACCTDGACRPDGQCEEAQPVSHYAYVFSTGDLPDTPQVVIACSDDYLSPTPWEYWEGGKDVCVNTSVSASFTESMDAASFTPDTVRVEKCLDDSCLETTSVTMSPATYPTSVSATAFVWDPAEGLESGSRYRVTILSGEDGVKSVGGAFLADDYTWFFETASDDEPCTVGGVYITPAEYTATELKKEVAYSASPIAAEYQCTILACSQYTWDFSSSDEDKAEIATLFACGAEVLPLAETKPGVPVLITGQLTEFDVSDAGELTVNFSDPEITSFWPSCDEACINAEIGAQFNISMQDTFSGYDTAGDSMVRLYLCEDPACASEELSEVSDRSVAYDPDLLTLTIHPGQTLEKDASYRVVVSGESLSESGVPLSEGSTDLAYGNDRSWTFTTKDEVCTVSRVEVSPSEAELSLVGDRQKFSAVPYGSPDACSDNGQRLQAEDYTWSAWGAVDDPDAVPEADVADLLSDGKILVSESLPASCSSSCVNAGSSAPLAVCGNNATACTSDAQCAGYGSEAHCNDLGQCVEPGEDCDDGNVNDGDGCSSICLIEGVVACASSDAVNCCGNGKREGREECDGGSLTNDKCSDLCLNEGAGTTYDCGDGKVAQGDSIGGEECDWGDANASYNCSANCLNLGSVPETQLYAICGDRVLGEGEGCDDGNTVSGDGCSSSCRNEGSSSLYASTCGNNTLTCSKDADCASRACNAFGQCVETGEDCDDGNTEDDDGCSEACLFEGSSIYYEVPSICVDGARETGEACDAVAAGTEIASFAVAEITEEAPQEVLAGGEGSAAATVTATETASGISGSATLTLDCSCASDYACGDTVQYGCGEANCCFERPTVVETSPSQDESGLCRNTAIWVSFDQMMDEESFVRTVDGGTGETEATLFLELVSVNGTVIDDSNYLTLCPKTYDVSVAATSDADARLLVRAWHWIVEGIARLFHPVSAAEVSCRIPVSYDVEQIERGSKARLTYTDLLEANATYQLVVEGDTNIEDENVEGVASIYGVGLVEGRTSTFAVGTEVCALEYVGTVDQGKETTSDFDDPSPEFFQTAGELHTLAATPYTLHGATREEIQEIPEAYEWVWSWVSSVPDTDASNAISVSGEDDVSASATAVANGQETAAATATVTVDTLSGTTGSAVTGTVSLTAFLCEHPWPDPDALPFPFADTADNASAFGLSDPYTNFSFYYCRDGEELLPALTVVETPQTPLSNVSKELLFLVDGTDDAIGVRVFSNPDYLSPDRWYEEVFAGSASSLELDGYEAVQNEDTLYVSAANQSGSVIYPNVYVISVNEDASSETKDIATQIQSVWSFNANDDTVTDLNVCHADGAYVQDPVTEEFIVCISDEDCAEVTYSDGTTAEFTDAVCDAEKAKLTRDMRRLTDASRFQDILDAYGEDHGHCSSTKGQACVADETCPGEETCLPDVPSLSANTFLRGFTASTWPSWSAALGNALGTALPEDPLNVFVDCPEGSDETYCWNGSEGTFSCSEGSHVYLLQSVASESYDLYFQLEYGEGATWAYPIDRDETDHGAIYAEYAGASSPLGFYANGQRCDGVPIGSSGLCGDGVVSSTESCEIGQDDPLPCTTSDGVDGILSAGCVSDCSRYQTESEAEAAGVVCTPYACGNGVIDPGEDCDDGSENGTYGACGEDCSLATAFYCGDGSIAGGEACDCGSDVAAMDAGAWSSSSLHCEAPNGQYAEDFDTSCTFDCAKPGPSCGDGELNGDEQCDGEYASTSGRLCGSADDYDPCTTDADCDNSACGEGGDVCPLASVCTSGNTGDACTEDTDCDVSSTKCSANSGCTVMLTEEGKCDTAFSYQLTRSRTCDDNPESDPSCTWNGWTDCVGGSQACGNGLVEGDEACDDGNTDSTDACTNACTLNVCGDGSTYKGKETCDEGGENGVACTAEYEDTCAYCTVRCQYAVVSGAYCGDTVVNGDEFCDADDLPMRCFKVSDTPSERAVTGTCATNDDCDETAGYVCTAGVGVCDSGSQLFGSGDTASIVDYNGLPCAAGSTASNARCGTTNTDAGTTAGTCVSASCANSCDSSCPFTYEQSALLIQTELAGATKQTSAELYSYLSGESPDTAVLFMPACTVGTQVTADVDMSGVTPPSVDVVFVTDLSGSMNTTLDSQTGDSRIEVTVDSTVQAVKDLFDEYAGNAAQMRISTVSFTNTLTDGVDTDGDTTIENSDGCYLGTSTKAALSWIDHGLGSSTVEREILYDPDTGVETYVDRANGATPTAAGLKCAQTVLASSTADHKVVILLSDGDPTVNLAGSYVIDVPEVVSVRDDLISDGVSVFTAAVTSDADLIGYMAHFSSDVCGTCNACEDSCNTECAAECDGGTVTDEVCLDDCGTSLESCTDNCGGVCVEVTCTGLLQEAYTECVAECGPCDEVCVDEFNACEDTCTVTDTECEDVCTSQCTSACGSSCPVYEDRDDCEPKDNVEYAYSAATAEELEGMYQTIVDSILGVTVGFTTEFGGETQFTSGVVTEGDDVVLPFPTGFDCKATGEWTIPVRLSFSGTGTVRLSDINLTYCPVE